MLRRTPWFALTALATLALAIGANTAIFSLISFALLQPLPYPDANKLFHFWFTTPGGSGLTFSIPEMQAVAAEKDIFEDVAAYDFGGPDFNISGNGDPEQVPAIHVAASYFRIFGGHAKLGHTFTADEDQPNGGRVVLLSHQLWRRHFGASSSIIGKAISLGGEPYTVVGVIAPEFHANPSVQLWLPLQTGLNNTSNAAYINVIGRLKPGITMKQANARLRLTFAAFLRHFPLFNRDAGFQVKALRETQAGEVRTALMVLLATVGFVLLIGCSNIASLLLARANVREHDMAVRAALGGSRGRLVALAVMLVAGAGLMIRTFQALRHVDTGLETHKVLTLQMSLQSTNFRDTATVSKLVDEAVKRLESVPGIVAAASTWTLPVEVAFGSSFTVEHASAEGEKVNAALMRPVSAKYCQVFGIPLKQGRFFTDRDTASSHSVAVISQALAKQFWPKGNAIGARIMLDKHLGPDFAAPPRQIIGVVGDVRDLGLNKAPEPLIYVPQSQVPTGITTIGIRILPISWVVRTAGEPYLFAHDIERELGIASSGLAVGRIRSMDDIVKQSTAQSDFETVLLAAFAAIAVLLSAVGAYGLIYFSIGQRMRELGIRAALGATPRQLQGAVIQQSLASTALGIPLGAIGTFALAGYMKSLLFGVEPLDPVSMALACGFLFLVAMVAALIPAKRARRFNPVDVLRSI